MDVVFERIYLNRPLLLSIIVAGQPAKESIHTLAFPSSD